MKQKKLFVLLCLVYKTVMCSSQIFDDFNDGSFDDGEPLLWTTSQRSGQNDFTILNGEVQSRGPAFASALFFSTEIPVDFQNNDVTWTFRVRYASGAPSGSNRMEIYLMSDRSDVSDSPTGYFVRLGESGSDDGIDLFHSGTSTAIINDLEDMIASGLSAVIRVTRSANGRWLLEADPNGGDDFQEIGFAEDNHEVAGNHFGVHVIHTSTRNDAFFFDDFRMDAVAAIDTIAPQILGAEFVSNQQIEIRFNEPIDASTASVSANYSIHPGVTVLDAELISETIALLTTSVLENGTSYTIRVSDVLDVNGNALLENTEVVLEYIVFEEPQVLDVVINEYMAAPGLTRSLPEVEYVELFNRSDKFFNLEGWGIRDESGGSSPFTSATLAPNSYLILTGVGNGNLFDEGVNVLEVSGFPVLNNSGDVLIIADSIGKQIHAVEYQSTTNSIANELVNPYHPCISINEYALSIDESGGTPGEQNSVFDTTPDQSRPFVKSHYVDNGLVVIFSESMDMESLLEGSYDVTGNLEINEIVPLGGATPNAAILRFSNEMVPGISYRSTLKGMKDCAGNTIESTTFRFGLGRKPDFGELIITEVMYDPEPAIHLPEHEYIELHNPTEEIMSTSGILLKDSRTFCELPAMHIFPGEYYVIASTSALEVFEGNVIGVSGFPSLSNTGEMLTLSHDESHVFAVGYDPGWHDLDKANGGYSLEMMDIGQPCLEARNWTSSMDPSGGTPGRVNSVVKVVPDRFPPEMIIAIALSNDSIRVDFSELIEPASLGNSRFSFSPKLTIADVAFNPDYPKSAYIILSQAMKENLLYSLSISGIADCIGNTIRGGLIKFALPISPSGGEIKLSEVLFNPRVNGVDFVEIYNDSDNYLSLEGWQLANDTLLEGAVSLAPDHLMMDPRAFLAVTTDSDHLLMNYPKGSKKNIVEVDALPSFPNEEGSVIVFDQGGVLAQRLDYDESYHYRLLEDVDGVSLERISFADQVNRSENWRSAASDVGFATPGYANSQSMLTEQYRQHLVANPKIFVPGNSSSNSAYTLINYQLDRSGQFANVAIYDRNGRLVKKLAQGVSLSTRGFMRWDGDTDKGNVARMGYYLIVFEVYDGNGNTQKLKETVVVGRDF